METRLAALFHETAQSKWRSKLHGENDDTKGGSWSLRCSKFLLSEEDFEKGMQLPFTVNECHAAF